MELLDGDLDSGRIAGVAGVGAVCGDARPPPIRGAVISHGLEYGSGTGGGPTG
jgi:hypothetical protein